MRRKSLLLFALFFLTVLPSQGQNTEAKVYKNETLNFQFQYPAAWILEDQAQELDYLSLFSPEALATKEQSLDLLVGIKTEVYLLPIKEELEQDLRGLKQCGELKINNTLVKQYCLQTTECFFAYTPIPTDSGIILFIAYIPEKAQIPNYFLDYKGILMSFSQIKNGSP